MTTITTPRKGTAFRRHPEKNSAGLTVAYDRLEYLLENNIGEAQQLAVDLMNLIYSWLPELVVDSDGNLTCPHCHAECNSDDSMYVWDTGAYGVYSILPEDRKVVLQDDVEHDGNNTFTAYICGGCGGSSRVPKSWEVDW